MKPRSLSLYSASAIITALACLAVALAAPRTATLDLSTPEKRLQLLLEVYREIPDLFDAADGNHPFDPMSLVEDQEQLQQTLSKIPGYQKRMQGRIDSLKTIEVRTQNQLHSESVRVTPEALRAWNDEVLQALDRSVPTGVHNPREALRKAIESTRILSQEKPASAYLGKLVASLEPALRTQIGPKIRGKSILESLDVLRTSLADTLPSTFRFEEFGFDHRPTLHEVLDFIQNKSVAQASLDPKLWASSSQDLPLLMEAYALNVNPYDPKPLTEDDLHVLKDPDFLKGKLPDAWNSSFKSIQSHAERTLTKTIRVSSDSRSIRIREVPPWLGIFRGATCGRNGSECSTALSFPFPNDPNERVFFLYDSEGQLKGYISATEVTANGKKSLYVITISGKNLNSSETQLALNGLYHSRKELDVEQILLPPAERLEALLNYEESRRAVEGYAKGQKAIRIQYNGPATREAIQNFSSENNTVHYDHMENNVKAVVFNGDAKIGASLSTQVQLTPARAERLPLSQDAVIGFLLDLHRSPNAEEKLGPLALKTAGVSRKDFAEFERMLSNPDRLPVHDWMELVSANLKKWDALPLANHSQYFLMGRLHSPDALSSANRTETIKALTRELGHYLKGQSHRVRFEVLRAHHTELSREPAILALLTDARSKFLWLDTSPANLRRTALLLNLAPPDWKIEEALVQRLSKLNTDATQSYVSHLVQNSEGEFDSLFLKLFDNVTPENAWSLASSLRGYPHFSAGDLEGLLDGPFAHTTEPEVKKAILAVVEKQILGKGELLDGHSYKGIHRRLKDIFAHQSLWLRDSAASMLSKAFSPDPETLEIARRFVVGPSSEVVAGAINLLASAPLDGTLLPKMVELLVHDSYPVSSAAARYIALLKPDQATVLPLLRDIASRNPMRFASRDTAGILKALGVRDQALAEPFFELLTDGPLIELDTALERYSAVAPRTRDSAERLDAILKTERDKKFRSKIHLAQAQFLNEDPEALATLLKRLAIEKEDTSLFPILLDMGKSKMWPFSDARVEEALVECLGVKGIPHSYTLAALAQVPQLHDRSLARIEGLLYPGHNVDVVAVAKWMGARGLLQSNVKAQLRLIEVASGSPNGGTRTLIPIVLEALPEDPEVCVALVNLLGKGPEFDRQDNNYRKITDYFRAKALAPSVEEELIHLVKSHNHWAEEILTHAQSISPKGLRALKKFGADRILKAHAPARAPRKARCAGGIAEEIRAIESEIPVIPDKE